MTRLMLLVTVSLALLLGATSVPSAEAASIVSRWGFGVQSGRVPDLSGGGRPLKLSGSWTRALGRGGSPAVRFRNTSIAVGKDRSVFDPGRRQFAVAVAFRAPSGMKIFDGTDSPNLVQKGRYASRGQWKLQLIDRNGGTVQCRMKGSARAVLITSSVGKVASDKRWHRATCVRHGGKVVLVVDGQRTVKRVRIGRVASDIPLTVANHAANSHSDQFRGLVDELVIVRGRGAGRVAQRAIRP